MPIPRAAQENPVTVDRNSSLIMLVLLVVLTFIYHSVESIYTLNGLEPPLLFWFLHTAALLCGVVWWLRAETKSSAVTSIYCQGLLVGLGYLVILPYHLLKTRGAAGLLPLLALIGSLVLSQIFAAVIYVVFSGQF
jgi:hypothetical protein